MVTGGDDALSRRVGQRVRALRKRRHLTQEELAGLVGRSVEAVSTVERGKSAPGLITLVRLAHALDVSPGELFDDAAEDMISPIRAGTMAAIADRLRAMDDRNLRIAAHLIEGLSEC